MLVLRLVDGPTIASEVVRAATFGQRLVGLIGRDGLEPQQGLYLPSTSSIHMLFMRFPIDCLFLGRPDGSGIRRVVGTRHALPAWRGVAWVRGAEGVVELAAGTLASTGVAPDDRVVMEPAAIGR